MVLDFAYKLARKSLSPSLYSAVSGSFVGRRKAWATAETYAGIFDYYRRRLGPFDGKVVLELGPGNQLFTARHFIEEGASRVILVEPKWKGFEFAVGGSAGVSGPPGVAENGVPGLSRVEAWGDLRLVPAALDRKVDLMCSHLVLEHLADLPSLFEHTARLLAEGGLAHHRVDLTDHTYHVFSKFPLLRRITERRALYHLRYSDSVFGLLNDPKCYMNRRMLPEFLDGARASGLAVSFQVVQKSERARIHPDLAGRCGSADAALLSAKEFILELRRP